MNMKNRDGVQDKPERTGTGERGTGKCAAVALFDGSERRLCINIAWASETSAYGSST